MSKKKTPSKRTSPLRWLFLALALFLISAFVMWSPDDKLVSHKPNIEFPEYWKDRDVERRDKNTQTLELLFKTAVGTTRSEELADPLLVALNGSASRGSYLVVDVAELKATPLGKIITDCLENDPNMGEIFKEGAGEQAKYANAIERISASDSLVMAAGQFEDIDWNATFDHPHMEQHDNLLKIYSASSDEDSAAQLKYAVWNNEIMIMSDDPESIEEAIGLLQGRIPIDEEVAQLSDAYGDVYGTLDVDSLGRALFDNDLASRFAQTAEDVHFHVDASEGFAMTSDVVGENSEQLGDLALAVSGALTAARIGAMAKGEEELSELLDFASVQNENEAFKVNLALPINYLDRILGDCSWIPKGP